MTRKTTKKIEGTIEAWDSRQLGADEAYVAVADVDEAAIDESLGLQMISIRLQKSLIDDFKQIAKLHGIGYQPLMRQVLSRFAESEKKLLLNKAVAQMERELAEEAARREMETTDPPKKTA